VVLGGGGAKGFAHIGVIQALKEHGIPIDFLGGTSAGALYGLAMGFYDFDHQKSYATAKLSYEKKLGAKKFVLPVLSLLTNKAMLNFIKGIFGELYFEDLWIQCFCVSTNFSDAKKAIHDKGLIWKSIAASIAVPGIFPPVLIEKKLHIDGGVMDNLPIETIQTYPVNDIYAIALTKVAEKEYDLQELPTSWSILWDKLIGAKKYRLPGLNTILLNSTLMQSNYLQNLKSKEISHYVELDLKGIPLIDDKQWAKTIAEGYNQMNKYLDSQT
jgi:NTE family protein